MIRFRLSKVASFFTCIGLVALAGPAAAQNAGIFYHPKPKTDYVFGFLLKQTTNKRDTFMGGIVVFKEAEFNRGKIRFRTLDNIGYGPSPKELFAGGFPTKRAMFSWSAYVQPETGNQPSISGTLPNELGRPEDWFLPRLVRSGDKIYEGRSRRYRETFSHVKTTDKALVMEHTRRYETYDGDTRMSGEGQITFDLNQGMLKERTFKGEVIRDGIESKLALRIRRLTEKEVKLLPPPPAKKQW